MNWKTAMNLDLINAQAAQEHQRTANTLKSLISNSDSKAMKDFFSNCLSLYEKAGYDL